MIAAMERRDWIAAYRVLFGLLALGTVGFRFVHNSRVDPGFSAVNFFSFFTIQSNLFAAVVLLCAGVGLTGRWSPRTGDLVRGAAVVYMATTGVVYAVLLAGTASQTIAYVGWADVVVHRIMPVVIVADWLIVPPRTRLTPRAALVWLWYPALFLAYSLIRGAIVGWYPYPFLTPGSVGGYAGVAAYSIGITLFILLVAGATVTIGNARRQLRQPSTAQASNVESMV